MNVDDHPCRCTCTRAFASPFPLITLLVCLLGTATLAQSAVVLDFKGDRRSRLQKQIEAALEKLEGVALLSSSEWERAARKEGLSGAQADSIRGVAVVAPKVGVTVAVGGRVKKTFQVTLVDARGKTLSSRTLKLRRGLLSKDDLTRLGRAVKAALEVSAAPMARWQLRGPKAAPTPTEEDAGKAEPLAALAPQEEAAGRTRRRRRARSGRIAGCSEGPRWCGC